MENRRQLTLYKKASEFLSIGKVLNCDSYIIVLYTI